MNTNEKGLSFSKIFDELIAIKVLKDLHFLTQKELELKNSKLLKVLTKEKLKNKLLDNTET